VLNFLSRPPSATLALSRPNSWSEFASCRIRKFTLDARKMCAKTKIFSAGKLGTVDYVSSRREATLDRCWRRRHASAKYPNRPTLGRNGRVLVDRFSREVDRSDPTDFTICGKAHAGHGVDVIAAHFSAPSGARLSPMAVPLCGTAATKVSRLFPQTVQPLEYRFCSCDMDLSALKESARGVSGKCGGRKRRHSAAEPWKSVLWLAVSSRARAMLVFTQFALLGGPLLLLLRRHHAPNLPPYVFADHLQLLLLRFRT